MEGREDRRNLTRTEEYYPHPAEGLDVEAARGRVEANPEVMPPHPSPRTSRSWQNREFFGMRALPIVGAIAAAMGLPLLVSWLSKKSRHVRHAEHPKVHRARKAHKKALMEKAFAPEQGPEKKISRFARKRGIPMPEGMPRFIVLASRPWGKKGKKARALILGKVAH